MTDDNECIVWIFPLSLYLYEFSVVHVNLTLIFANFVKSCLYKGYAFLTCHLHDLDRLFGAWLLPPQSLPQLTTFQVSSFWNFCI